MGDWAGSGVSHSRLSWDISHSQPCALAVFPFSLLHPLEGEGQS